MIYWDLEQGTPEWFKARLGIPTASDFGRLVTPGRMEPSKQLDDYAAELAAERYAEEPVDRWTGNAYTEHGHAMEDEARAYYEMMKGTPVATAGFVRSSDLEAGMSPDGLMLGVDGALEIKSPGHKQLVRCLSLTECPREYLLQAQGQILVGWEDGVRWVDVLVYHSQLPPKVFHVEPIEKIQSLLRYQIEKVCQERDRYLEIIRSAA